jgi:hypothetical protein
MKKAKKQYRTFSAMEKVKAVLSVWAERRKPSEACKELGIKWAHLNHWQNQALAGMLKGLEGRSAKDKKSIPALGSRLQTLLEKNMSHSEKAQEKLDRRLNVIQKKNDGQKERPSTLKK